MKKHIYVWLLLLLAGIFTAGCVFVTAQQVVRLGANNTPAAIARETLIKIKNEGQSPEAAVGSKTDISETLTPFVIVFDNNKNLIATSASYGSEKYKYPTGVLNSVSEHNDNRVTWQPKIGLRFATVAI